MIDVVLLDKLVKKKTLLVYKVTPQPLVSFHLLLLVRFSCDTKDTG